MTAGSWLPAVGQLLAIHQRPFVALEHWRRRHGPRFLVDIPGMPPLIFLADRDDARTVFDAPPSVLLPGEGGKAISPIVGGESFMLADGEEHLRGRALLREAFTVATARRRLGMLSVLAETEVATWPRDEPVSLHPRLRAFALRVVLLTIFGDEEEIDGLVGRLLSLLDVAASPVLGAPPTRHLPPFRATWRRFLRQRIEVDALVYRLIDARMRDRAGDATDTLQILVDGSEESGRPLSREYIRDSVMSVVLAGHETTSSALAWTFALLAHDQDAQARAAADARYLCATIYEAMRHRPVFVFAIPRAVGTRFALGDETFDPPARLLPCVYLIHHDPANYVDPGVFMPERFLGALPDRSIWIPWGAGRRRCPGRHLALAEIEAVVGAALARFTVGATSPSLEPPTWRSVIVTPRRGARVVLRAR